MPKKVIFFVNGTNNHDPRFYLGEKLFPIGVGFLISICRQAGHDVHFIDRYLNPDKFTDLSDFDFIGVYSSSICRKDAEYILAEANKVRKQNSILAIGGPHATVFPDQIENKVDYIVRGEGEKIILDLINGDLEKGVIQTERLEDLDNLPFLPWDIFSKMPYNNVSEYDGTVPTWNMNTSRGCPFACSFCHSRDMWGRRPIGMSGRRIVDEIEYIQKNYGVKGIYFREDLFTFNIKRVVEFCEEILKRNIKINWYCESRVNVKEEYIKLMKKSGCSGIYAGVESGSQKILDIFNKRITREEIIDFFTILHKYDIKTYASFVTDHPLETDEDKAETDSLISIIKPNKFCKNKFREDF